VEGRVDGTHPATTIGTHTHSTRQRIGISAR
jgi:hypothetical protein